MARKKIGDPASEAPLPVSARAIKAAVLLMVVGLAAFGLWRLEKLNRKVQAERWLTADPELATWIKEMKAEIATSTKSREAAGGGREAGAEALWFGRVAAQVRNAPDKSAPALVGLKLNPAYLEAGTHSQKDFPDGDGVASISVRNFPFRTGEPQRGEWWVFAVSRQNGGYNFLRDAWPVKR